MTDARRFHAAPQDALIRLELWSGAAPTAKRFESVYGARLPGPGQALWAQSLRVVWREPGAWMVRAPLEASRSLASRLADVVGSDGAVTDISGAAVRCALAGPDWRILLTHGGVFDAEAPDFGPGCTAGTVIEHIAVRFDVIADDQVDAYVAPSFADDLYAYWTAVAGDLLVSG